MTISSERSRDSAKTRQRFAGGGLRRGEWSAADLIDLEDRTVSPLVFSDPEVYPEEQNSVFGSCWLFVGHESAVAKVGSYVTSFMGEDAIFICRDKALQIRVYLNSCPHRGMKLCRDEHGTATRFVCPYHAWTFNLEGELIGVPGLSSGYHNQLDKSAWGLIRVPRVEVYRGLIFACFDEHVEALTDYLGEMKWYLDIMLNRTEGGMVALPGVFKWAFPANWKLGPENFCGDNIHVPHVHRSLVELGGGSSVLDFNGVEPLKRSFQVGTVRGHGCINVTMDEGMLVHPRLQEYRLKMMHRDSVSLDDVQKSLISSVRIGTIFPNFSFVESFGWSAIRVYHPRGPDRTEAWTWLMVDSDMPDDIISLARDSFIRMMAPAGIVESDDAEMWIRCQEMTRTPYRSRIPLNYQMGAGFAGVDSERPGMIDRPPTEIGTFGYYEQWRKLMGQTRRRATTKEAQRG